MQKNDGDAVLIAWMILITISELLVFGMTAYVVFWKSRSGWWFLFAILITYSPTFFEALKKRFDLPDDKDHSQ